MRMTMTQAQLLSLLTHQGAPAVSLPDGRKGYLHAVQREDGSGRSFNVTVMVPGGWRLGAPGNQLAVTEPVHVYVRAEG